MRKFFLTFFFIQNFMVNYAYSEKPFKVCNYFFPTHLDTTEIRGLSDYIFIENLGGTLLGLGVSDRYYSYLSKSWQPDWDKKEVVFELHENLKFSDGSPLTSEDVEFSFKRLILKGAMHLTLQELIKGADKLKTVNDRIEGIEIIDKQRIRFRFNKMSSVVFYILTLPDSAIIAQKQVNKETLSINNWDISSGPYFIKHRDKEKFIFKANPHFIFFSKDMPEQIEIYEVPKNIDMINGLLKNKFLYTLQNTFFTDEEYKLLEKGKNIDILIRNFGETHLIWLNKKHPPFNNKKVRQAIYKLFMEKAFDFRPTKENKIFFQANQLLLPTTAGRLDIKEVEKIISSFPDKIELPKKSFKFEWMDSSFGVSKEDTLKLLSFFKEIGIEISYKEFTTREEWHQRNNSSTPFMLAPMSINEMELQQSFEYLYKADRSFAENGEKIFALNQQLADTDDLAKKSEIIKEISRLIIDDAVLIPLYYGKYQDFINKDYEIIGVNDFASTPKLWNIRKKKPLKN